MCAGSTKAFAAASDYSELGDEDKRCIRAALVAEQMLEKAQSGLAALIINYKEFPLAFLADAGSAGGESTLDDLRDVLVAISDRTGHAATFAQTTMVHLYFVNKKLNVAPGMSLANLSAIEEYPYTEESRKVAASVRAAVIAQLSMSTLLVGEPLFGIRAVPSVLARRIDAKRY